MRGNSAKDRPGGRARFGPAHETGEQRSEKTGSVMMVSPPTRMRNVLWPMKVTAAVSCGGSACGSPAGFGSGGWGGQGFRSPPNRQRRMAMSPPRRRLVGAGASADRGAVDGGLKKISPL